MKEKITIFNADISKKTSKTPISPYADNTFIFETYEAKTNLEMFNVLVSKFILNIPLTELEAPIRTFRRKINLEQYYSDTITHIILDIDNVKTIDHKRKILEYFKNVKCIIGESRSYNNIDNFNMKGILFIEELDIEDAKSAISNIHFDLKDSCTIDEHVSRKTSLNAPINKNNVLLNNENSPRFKSVVTKKTSAILCVKDSYIGKSIHIPVSELKDIEATSIEKICLKAFHIAGFTAVKNNQNDSISFKHPTEEKSPGGYFWFSTSPYTMHHNNSVKSLNIFDNIRVLPQAKLLMTKDINYADEFQHYNTETEVISVNERFLEVTPCISAAIDSFLIESNGLFSIRSPMGTGKSTIIKEIIDSCRNTDLKVLIITNRISVATDFSKKYDMKLYNQDKYEIGDSLICQFDSLWRYNMKLFDVVIMDEFISLMMHSRNNLGNSSLNVAKFFGTFNKKLVIADAFLTGYENFLLSNKKENVYLLDNSYRDPTILMEYQDQNKFVDSLSIHALKHKCTVSSTSLSFINSLEMYLTKKDIKVVTLTASTPQSTKDLIYKIFEDNNLQHHDFWDVLIFSPTLTVGVSNLNNVPYHFHYDSSMSTDVISSIQMMKRTRKTKEIHFFIKERINYIKTSYDTIRDEYMGNIGKNITQNYLFDIDDYGESKLSSIGKKSIKIDTFKNILEFNHKKATLWLLQYHFIKEPRIVTEKLNGNVLLKYTKALKKDKKIALKNTIEQFLTLNNFQKTSLLEDSDSDKVLKTLANIDESLIECSGNVKTKILEFSLEDPKFIEKCKNYKAVFNYCKKIWDTDDIKNLVSKSVINNNMIDLQFFNMLLIYGQHDISDEYSKSAINNNKLLKSLLSKCGYSEDTSVRKSMSIGYRGFGIDPKVKEYFYYID